MKITVKLFASFRTGRTPVETRDLPIGTCVADIVTQLGIPAAELGISVGKVNYVLRALVEKGLVKLENFQLSQNKLRYAYVLTPAGAAVKVAMTAGFLGRKIAEFDRLKQEIDTVMAEVRDRAPGNESG